MKSKVLVLWLCAAFSLGLYAKQSQSIKNFYKSDYNFGAQNWSLGQQVNGIMYFANMNGLLGYDGSEWDKRPFEGAGNNVHTMLVADNGDIYIASQNEFGVFRASENGLQDYESLVYLVNEESRNFREIWHINQLGGTVVFQADEYLFIYDGKSINTIKTPDNIKYSTVIGNTLYLCSQLGSAYMLLGNSFAPLMSTEDLNGKSVCAIIPNNNSLIFITERHGAYIYEDSMMRKAEWGIDPMLIKYHAFCAKRDGDVLAIGTVQNGVILYNLKTSDVEIINLESGLQNNTVLGVCFDIEHNLWLGLDRGISYVKINTPFTPVFAQHNPYGSGYCSILVGNTVYLGTNQGLFTGKYESGEIKNIEIVEGTQGQVYDIKLINNHLYCCHHNGLFEVSGKYARKIVNVEGIWTVQRLKSNPRYLIAGHYHGFTVLKRDGNQWVYSNNVSGFEESSRLFEQDDMGYIWMTHGLKGVYRIKLSNDFQKAESVDFYDTTKGFKSNLYISVFNIGGTMVFAAEDGLYTYNTVLDKMEIDTALQDKLLGEGHYFYMQQDAFDRLWLLKNQSITCIERNSSGQYVNNGSNSFIIPEDLQFEYFDITALDYNHILVANEEGFTIVNKNLLDKTENQDIYIRQISSLTSNKPLICQYLKKQEGENIIPELEYADNSIRITYGSASFSAVKNNQVLYSTRLIGYEDEWSEMTNRTTKEYTNLKEGVYTFQVKSVNNSSEDNFTEFTFKIEPPFYRSIWAYILYIILFIALLYASYRYMRYKEEKLEKEKEQELQKQKQLHDQETEAKEKEIIALKNEQLESEVAYKSKELAGYTMNMVRKNETLILVKDELEKIYLSIPQTEQSKATRAKLSSLINGVNESIEHDEDWRKFEENFDHIHQDFIKRLSEQFTGLTLNDKKLCAYLKMNLVSKDIAPLMNISIRGVEIGRYRLRKKLGLDRDTNLTDFLQKF